MSGRLGPVDVRRAVPEDAAEIVRLAKALNAHQRDPTGILTVNHIRAHAFGTEPWFHVVVAATAGERLVGVALWERAFELAYAVRGAYLSAIWVEPGHRRRGIAGAMLDLVAADVSALGGSHVWWVSQEWNAAAHATYQRLGAIEKPVKAHALLYGEFEAAAARGGRQGGTGSGGSMSGTGTATAKEGST
jgi:ribosomal protein S18 acetylase RimI-like enzyme